MLFKLIVAIAVIVLLVALVACSIKIGKRLGRDQARREANFIDANTYHRLGNFVRALLAPPENIDEFVVLPPRFKTEANELIELIGAAPRLVRRK